MRTVGSLPEAPPVSRAAVLEERYRGRLPASLDALIGPGHGTVQLPTHIAWSGLTAFDVDRLPLCASMYQVVLTEGLPEDLAAYLDRWLLIRPSPSSARSSGALSMTSGKRRPGTHRRAASPPIEPERPDRRLLRDVLEIGDALPFVITGGYPPSRHTASSIDSVTTST